MSQMQKENKGMSEQVKSVMYVLTYVSQFMVVVATTAAIANV